MPSMSIRARALVSCWLLVAAMLGSMTIPAAANRARAYGEALASEFSDYYQDAQFAAMTINHTAMADLRPLPKVLNGPTSGTYNYLSFQGYNAPGHSEERLLRYASGLQNFSSADVVTIYTKHIPCLTCAPLLIDWDLKELRKTICVDWCTNPIDLDGKSTESGGKKDSSGSRTIDMGTPHVIAAIKELWYSDKWSQMTDSEAFQSLVMLKTAGFRITAVCPLTVPEGSCTFQHELLECALAQPLICDACVGDKRPRLISYINFHMPKQLRDPQGWKNAYYGVRIAETSQAWFNCAAAAANAVVGPPL